MFGSINSYESVKGMEVWGCIVSVHLALNSVALLVVSVLECEGAEFPGSRVRQVPRSPSLPR